MLSTCPTKQYALDLFELTREEWLRLARAAALKVARMNGTVTADDIHEHVPIPAEYDGRVMGAVFRGKEWECIGYVRSRRAVCHFRPIGQFRLRGVESHA